MTRYALGIDAGATNLRCALVDESGKTVRSVADVKKDEHISVYVSDGKIFGTVSGTEQEKFYGAETEE